MSRYNQSSMLQIPKQSPIRYSSDLRGSVELYPNRKMTSKRMVSLSPSASLNNNIIRQSRAMIENSGYGSSREVSSLSPSKHKTQLDIPLPPLNQMRSPRSVKTYVSPEEHALQKKSYKLESSSKNESARIINKEETIKGDVMKAFDEKYKAKFVEGFNEKILQKCLELLYSEDNPILLENILPGKYADFIRNIGKPAIKKVNSVNNSGYQMLRGYIPYNASGTFLPPIKQAPNSTKGPSPSADFLHSISTDRRDQSLHFSFGDEEWSSHVSLKNSVSLPKASFRDFKESLSFMSNPSQKSILVLMSAISNTITIDFGFCEVIFEDPKSNAGRITKYFVGKIYRKLNMVEPITVKVLNYLFKKYNFEKITIEILSNNHLQQKEMRSVGFKLIKVDRLETQYKTYVLKKQDFSDYN